MIPETELDVDTITDRRPSWIPTAHTVSWQMLMVTTLAMLMISIDRQILPTVLPAIMSEFNLSSAEAGWLNSLTFIGSFLGAIVVGVLADQYGTGHKRSGSWLFSCGITVASGLATVYSQSITWLQTLRITMGFGTGAMEPINVAVVNEFWQKENRGFALGVHQIGMPLGQFIGPLAMGLILLYGDWRMTFLWIPLVGLPIMFLQNYIGRKSNEERVYAWIKEKNLTLPINDTQATAPSIRSNLKEAVKNKNSLLCLLMFFLFLWAEMGVGTFITHDLTSRLGISLSEAAMISGASGIIGWVGQIFWGSLSDRKGRKWCLTVITLGFSACIALLILIDSIEMAWALLIFWGVFRNSPYVVLFSLLLDKASHSAGGSLGLLIGIGLGAAGFLVGPASGYIIEHFGWSWNYAMLSISCLAALLPLYFVKDTINDH
jgi:MFS family permease